MHFSQTFGTCSFKPNLSSSCNTIPLELYSLNLYWDSEVGIGELVDTGAIDSKKSRETVVQFSEAQNNHRRVGRLWCNLASTNQLEESGDWGALYRAQNNQRRVGRLWCNSASTNQLEESGDWRAHYRAQNIWRKVTRLWCNSASTNQLEESGDWCAHYPARKTFEGESKDFGAILRAQTNRRVGRLMCHPWARNIWKQVTGLWCNSASTNQLEESGDWCATTEHETSESKSTGLWCNSASTNQ